MNKFLGGVPVSAPNQATHTNDIGNVPCNSTSRPTQQNIKDMFTPTPTPTPAPTPLPSHADPADFFIKALNSDQVKSLLRESIAVPLEQISQNTTRITQLETQVANLSIELDELRQYSRRNAIRIHNDWPETRGENTDEIVLDCIYNVLGIRNIDIDITRKNANLPLLRFM